MNFLSELIIPKNLWSSRSSDLSPCNFFLWGYVKDNKFLFIILHLLKNWKHRGHSLHWRSEAAKSIPEPVETSSSISGYGRESISNISCNLLFYFDFTLFSVFSNIAFSINPLAFFLDTLYFVVDLSSLLKVSAYIKIDQKSQFLPNISNIIAGASSKFCYVHVSPILNFFQFSVS